VTATLETLPFDNTYARLGEGFYRRLAPTPLERPHLVSFNPDAAALIGLDPREAGRPDLIDLLGGTRPLPGSDPVAMLYAGHQFGHYVPQLGDGRAILLGEVRGAEGVAWDLHLKGAGRTPFSRNGDGRAVLRSVIREYLASEAMHGLGIPTTRALCIIGSEEEVHREQIETGAMLVRLAPSHVRFGSFEVFYYREQPGQLARLADYVIDHHYPELVGVADRYPRLLEAVVVGTAELLAAWQAVGFAHGVMNTDNMSILGITLDYGPYGFLDAYDPGHVCNHSDRHGRYAFDRQPEVAHWNLGRLAQALLPLLAEAPEAAVAAAYAALDRYQPSFRDRYDALMRAKLGLAERRESDPVLVARLLTLLDANRVDYTIFFRALCRFRSAPGEVNGALRDQFLDREAFDAWANDYRQRLGAEASDDAARRARMERVNPKYVLRSYLAQQAIDRATRYRDYGEIERLRLLLRDPFAEQPEREAYAGHPPEWAGGISVSCSS
jgi:hypothetical protein